MPLSMCVLTRVLPGRESDDCNDIEGSDDEDSEEDKDGDTCAEESQGVEAEQEGEDELSGDAEGSGGVVTGADMLALYRYAWAND